MAWRIAESLEVLRRQFNTRYPTRNKLSDGGIGDAAHATRDSDHNPWLVIAGTGVVTARDFTHDPGVGMDIDRLTDELAASRDPRIKYIIANGYILDSRPGNRPWQWVKYNGSNAHTKHFHLSVMPNLCDDARPWNLPSFGGTAPTPAPTPAPNPAPVHTPGGIESMAFTDSFVDSYGNRQSVESWMKETQRDLNDIHAALLSLQPSRIPGDKNQTRVVDAVMDSASWVNQTLGLVARGGNTPEAVAAALRPVIVEAVTAALGTDNQAQADAIVDELSKRLA